MKCFIQIFRISFLFFIILTSVCCQHPDETTSVTLVSKDDKAVGVVIRGVGVDGDEVRHRMKIQLITSAERVPVLGEFKVEKGDVVFEPLVPLTRGLKYEILLDDELISEIEIPAGDFDAPELLAIYPTQDTLPENLLKMYFEFSGPMVEGRSLSHIALIRSDGDTMKGTFLNLQPELWNESGTVLTVWLDPGRIKRDLIPNKELGAPLKAGEQYTLHVNKSWQSKDGLSLSKNYSKTFVTCERDENPPDLRQWKINVPTVGIKQPLIIDFAQALDYFLIKEVVTLRRSDGEPVHGTIVIEEEEKSLKFYPSAPWTKGRFTIYVESRLEDLAGNNLNHPFDRIIGNDAVNELSSFTRSFEIQ